MADEIPKITPTTRYGDECFKLSEVDIAKYALTPKAGAKLTYIDPDVIEKFVRSEKAKVASTLTVENKTALPIYTGYKEFTYEDGVRRTIIHVHNRMPAYEENASV